MVVSSFSFLTLRVSRAGGLIALVLALKLGLGCLLGLFGLCIEYMVARRD